MRLCAYFDPVARLITRLYRHAQARNTFEFRRDVAGHLDLFRRENRLKLEERISRVSTSHFPRAPTLETMGDYFLELAEGPVAVFRDLAFYAYGTAVQSSTDDGRLLFRLGAACLQRIYSDREQNVLEARRHLETAIERLPPSDATNRGLAYNLLGLAYSEAPFSGSSTEPGMAIACFREALRVFDSPETLAEKAMVLLHMGNVHGPSDPESALGYYREARQSYLDLRQWEDVARAEQNLGLALLDRKEGDPADNIEQALSFLRSSLTRISKEKHPYDYAVGLQNLGKALAQRIRGKSEENFHEAIRVFHDAGQIFLDLGNRFAARSALTGEGGMRYELSQWGEASNLFDRAIDLLESDWSEHAAAQSRLRLARDQALLIDFAVLAAHRSGNPGKALETMERGRNRLLAASYFAKELLQPGPVATTWWIEFQHLVRRRAGLEQELTRARMQQQGEVADAYTTRLEREVEECRLRQEESARKIQRKNPDFLPVAAPLRFEEIRRLAAGLNSPVCALRPTDKGTIVFAFLASGEFRHEVVEAVTTKELRKLLLGTGCWVPAYQELQKARESPSESIRQELMASKQMAWIESMDPLLEELHRNLIRPCLSLLELPVSRDAGQVRPRLYLMAGGMLNLLPLHATFEKREGKRSYLADVADVAHFSSFRLLSRALDNARRSRLERLTAFEAPTDDLPYARWEISLAGSLFGPNHCLVTQDEGEIRRLLSRPVSGSAVLFSCHAESHTTDALRSGLFLKPHTHELPDYSLAELLGVNLSGCPLVVLGACETSLAEFHDPADECLNLANAFVAAGAAGVVGTQWEANDVAAALWCGYFLHQLRDGSADPFCAACAASRWVRDSDNAEKTELFEAHPRLLPPAYREDLKQDFWHPYFWANHKFHGVGGVV